MHPYEGAQTLRHRAKQESVRLNYGSLYAVVESLEKKGFIKAAGTLREGKRPERTVYEITDAGAREMTDWMTELIGVPRKEYPAFMAGLSFVASLPPDDALAALRGRADALKVRLASMRGALKATREAGLPRPVQAERAYEERPLPPRRLRPRCRDVHVRAAGRMTRGPRARPTQRPTTTGRRRAPMHALIE